MTTADRAALAALEPAVMAVRDAALGLVQDERGVRVEDYLTALAAAAGEATLVDAGLFDIEATDLTPGAAVFGDAVNDVLSGDTADLAALPPTSTVGVLRDRLVPTVVPATAFGDLERRYARVAASVGSLPWGQVAVSVPDDHRPWVLPLQAAFELRPAVVAVAEAVDQAFASGDLIRPDGWGRHVLVAAALAAAIEQGATALDPTVAIDLALDVVFGMAKVVPMSRRAFEAAASDAGSPDQAGGPGA